MVNHSWVYKGRSCSKFDGEKKIQKDAVYGSHRSCFSDKPDYCGCPFTERQQAIIDGESVTNVRKREVTVIINKAEYIGRYDIAEMVYDAYGGFYHERHLGDPSAEEALKILDSLTPDDLKSETK